MTHIHSAVRGDVGGERGNGNDMSVMGVDVGAGSE